MLRFPSRHLPTLGTTRSIWHIGSLVFGASQVTCARRLRRGGHGTRGILSLVFLVWRVSPFCPALVGRLSVCPFVASSLSTTNGEVPFPLRLVNPHIRAAPTSPHPPSPHPPSPPPPPSQPPPSPHPAPTQPPPSHLGINHNGMLSNVGPDFGLHLG